MNAREERELWFGSYLARHNNDSAVQSSLLAAHMALVDRVTTLEKDLAELKALVGTPTPKETP